MTTIEWQPIATVPKNQPVLLAYFEDDSITWVVSGMIYDPPIQGGADMGVDFLSDIRRRQGESDPTHWAEIPSK